MSFDPSQNAAILAALIERCRTTYPTSAGQFTLAQKATNRLTGNHPSQLWLQPKTSSRLAIAWSAIYRATRLPGYLIVVDTVDQALGEAAILASAVDAFNLLDLKILHSGGATGALGVLPGQQKPFAFYDPGRVGDARWVNAPPYPKQTP